MWVVDPQHGLTLVHRPGVHRETMAAPLHYLRISYDCDFCGTRGIQVAVGDNAASALRHDVAAGPGGRRERPLSMDVRPSSHPSSLIVLLWCDFSVFGGRQNVAKLFTQVLLHCVLE